MAVLGVDVSRHQGTIDWNKVKSAGVKFAFIKATDGTSYAYTSYFRTQLAAARAAGIPWLGGYHWLQPGNGAAQARYFVAIMAAANGGTVDGLVCIVDVEKNPSGTFPSITTLREFAAEFKRLTGGHPLVVYTGAWFWKDYLKNAYGADIGPLWHSEYETTDAEIADGPELANYGGWGGCTIWQYTSSGSLPGIAGSCDLNLYFGSDLNTLARTGANITKDWFDMATLEELDGLLAKHAMIVAGTVMDHITKMGKIVDFVQDPDNPAVVWLVFGSAIRWAFDTSTPEGAHSLSDFQNHWGARGQTTAVQQWNWFDIKGVPIANGAPPAQVTIPTEAIETAVETAVDKAVRNILLDAAQA